MGLLLYRLTSLLAKNVICFSVVIIIQLHKFIRFAPPLTKRHISPTHIEFNRFSTQFDSVVGYNISSFTQHQYHVSNYQTTAVPTGSGNHSSPIIKMFAISASLSLWFFT